MTRTLERLPATLAVARLTPEQGWPWWATYASFASVTRTPHEVSVVCDEGLVPHGVRAERDFAAYRVAGSLAFSEVGVLASLTGPLAIAQVSCFTVSTFDTDYILIRLGDVVRANSAWTSAGFVVRELRP